MRVRTDLHTGDGTGVIGPFWCRIGVSARFAGVVADTLRRLAAQQMPACDEQIGQRAGHEQTMRVLPQPAIAHLGKAEHPLDDPDRMFNPPLSRGQALARTLDLVRFFARSISSTTPRWRYRRLTKSCAFGACCRITARWPR